MQTVILSIYTTKVNYKKLDRLFGYSESNSETRTLTREPDSESELFFGFKSSYYSFIQIQNQLQLSMKYNES